MTSRQTAALVTPSDESRHLQTADLHPVIALDGPQPAFRPPTALLPLLDRQLSLSFVHHPNSPQTAWRARALSCWLRRQNIPSLTLDRRTTVDTCRVRECPQVASFASQPSQVHRTPTVRSILAKTCGRPIDTQIGCATPLRSTNHEIQLHAIGDCS